MYFKGLLKLNIKTFAALFVRALSVDLQALVYKQETRNVTLHSAAPRAELNFLFLVCKRVLVGPPMVHSKSAVILNYNINDI